MSGAEKQLFELATRINKSTHKVLVCALRGEQEGELLEKLRAREIATRSLNINSKFQFFKIFKLYSLIREYDPDILESFLFFDNVAARIFGKLAKVPIIISGERNVDVHRSKLRNIFDRFTAPLSDHFISNSEAGKNMLIAREHVPNKKITVIHNGIAFKNNQIRKTSNHNIKKIGFVGRLTEQKGLEYLLNAVKKLKDKKRRVTVEIIGDGSERERLEYLACKLGVQNVVYFLERKPQAWHYMQTFDVLVLPSLWEGLPNVLMEAMASYVPVVATTVGGVPELIEDGKNGFLVRPKDASSLAEKLDYVLNMKKVDLEQITQNAQHIIEKMFSIEKMVREHELLYKELLINT